ncbi:hypothetical protein EXIGLDRAFT_764809 [Exidia glandulosa HHB12029]|uniref:Uncharacterized protein n=1 Tax=Exidia glandulosa HHB12029 TaxID=1314781 RepID=A0A165KXQ2_EXIGL|nr:hypothetical protein EXIGLDRAFT_764809 [Exidia glandulosa HHB12029]
MQPYLYIQGMKKTDNEALQQWIKPTSYRKNNASFRGCVARHPSFARRIVLGPTRDGITPKKAKAGPGELILPGVYPLGLCGLGPLGALPGPLSQARALIGPRLLTAVPPVSVGRALPPPPPFAPVGTVRAPPALPFTGATFPHKFFLLNDLDLAPDASLPT